jgi:hypothetical protein
MNRYWIEAMSDWTPEVPAAPPRNFKNLAKEIKFIEEIKELERENIELRRTLENAITIIRQLDYKITELKAEISLLKEEEDKEHGLTAEFFRMVGNEPNSLLDALPWEEINAELPYNADLPHKEDEEEGE